MPATGMGQDAGVGNAAALTAKAVLMSPFSGPTGSPYDTDEAGNASTGALNTGIGFGIGSFNSLDEIEPNFTDDYIPGVTLPDGTTAPDARLTAIGGGLSDETGEPTPYNAQPLLGFGNGGARDAGAGPAFTGFGGKIVTAAADVAEGGVIETGFVNRTGAELLDTLSALGSSTTASAAVAEA